MRPVSNIDVSATRTRLTALWEEVDCVDHYIMKLRKIGPVDINEYGSEHKSFNF